MATIKLPFDLMQDEDLLLITRPHPLAMLGLALFWLGVAALGVVFMIYYDDLTGYLKKEALPLESLGFFAQHLYDVVWVAALLLPLIVMAVFRINFGYVIVLLVLIVARGLRTFR